LLRFSGAAERQAGRCGGPAGWYNVAPACSPLDIAARTSLSPATLGSHTRVHGHGVLALTECGRENGIPRAAQRI
jgi:hypothetical protein